MTPVRNEHDASSAIMVAQSGNVLVEYGLVITLVALAAVASLTVLGATLQKQLLGLADAVKGRSTMPMVSAQSVPLGAGPTISTHPITLSNGKVIVVDEYPLDTDADNQSPPEPASQQTQIASRQLSILTDTLRQKSLISQEQADSLLSVVQQLDRLARIEKPLDDAYQTNTQVARAMIKSTVRVDGKDYSLAELLMLIRADASLRGQAPEIQELLDRLDDAKETGALNDPVIADIIDHMMARVQNAAMRLSQRANVAGPSSNIQQESGNADMRDHVLGENG